MLKYVMVLIICTLTLVSTQQQQQSVEEKEKEPKDIVVREVSENDGSGNFYWLRETLDGGRSEQRGYFKDGHQVIEGSYTEIGKDGTPLTTNYVADKTGYHPVGAHLPRSA